MITTIIMITMIVMVIVLIMIITMLIMIIVMVIMTNGPRGTPCLDKPSILSLQYRLFNTCPFETVFSILLGDFLGDLLRRF